ncbi:hypothetical protein WJR50_28530 [Catalinimonas sp. 4WD22]|uniref:hypothetical protein n=1 Tax=Catalinimonas locisalis TaxID=3133978 RepID=UPI003100B24A
MKIIHIAILMLWSFDALSCSCGNELSVKEAFNTQELIVRGEVIGKELIEIDSSGNISIQDNINFNQYQFIRYELAIQEVYKGEFSQDTISVYSSVTGASCGYFFHTDREYLIYGRGEEMLYRNDSLQFPSGKNLIWTHMCTKTKPYEKKEARILRSLSKKR